MTLKRIKYISAFARPYTDAEIDALVQEAAFNNEVDGITGILAATGNIFFQIIEGPAEKIDSLYAKIVRDSRHVHVVLLREETLVESRLYPDWAMKKIDLSDRSSRRLEPLHAILETVSAQMRSIETLTGVLERGIWNEFISREP